MSKEIRASILALALLSLGGLLLHIRIHPPTEDALDVLPTAMAAATLVLVPVLFARRRTAPWAYLLNLLAVIVGTVGMAWFAAANLVRPVTFRTLVLESTLADILILWAKLPLGQQIMWLYRRSAAQEPGR